MNVKAKFTEVDYNPHMSDFYGNHYRVTLTYQKRRMSTIYSMGTAYTEPPTVAEVLECLFLDASHYDDCDGFEDWCSDYGYDTDSIKAERIYKAIARQAFALHRLLGDDYDAIRKEVIGEN